MRVRRGDVIALDGLDLVVEPGEIVAVLGPNGAGKTTTLETIEGYHRPEAGQCQVLGVDPHSQRAEIAHRWGVMPQTGGLPTGMTVGEAVQLFAGLGHRDPAVAAARARHAIETAGVADIGKRRWRRLSGGQQQRLSLALALCGGDDLLLLDEPTVALDHEGRARTLQVVANRAAEGAGVVITTHRFDDIERLAHRVVIIDRGRVKASGTLAELTGGRDEITFTVAETLPPAVLAELGRDGAIAHDLGGGRYRLGGAAGPEAVARLTATLAAHGVTPRSVDAGHRSLEELYSELVDQ